MENEKIKMKNDNAKLKMGKFSSVKSDLAFPTPYTLHPTPSSRGFTLIETFVAITVLLLAITGPLTIASRGLLTASFARDQITAYYLAQEAMELIRNKRDNNSLSGQADWKNGLTACFEATGCSVDAADSDPVFTSCSGACPVLYRDGATGFYSYNTGVGMNQSPFTRTITMAHTPPNTPDSDEFRVSVRISWNTGVLSKTFVVEDSFLNWQ